MTEKEISIYKSLDRLKESYPELSSAAKILSRYPMAFDGEKSFVRDFADKLEGGSREARKIYRAAFNIQESAALIWANIKDAVSPYYCQTIFNNLPQDFLDHIKSIPEYDRLFGSLDYISCDHCRSIFGPAAYYADLMRFADTYISRQGQEDNARSTRIPPECTLVYRRPDLYKVRLDCSNSNEMIPQIDLVNELLEAFIDNEYHRDAYLEARDAIFPQSLPFNRPLEEIRSYLKRYNTSLYQIYNTFDKPFGEHPLSEKGLELSSNDLKLITSGIYSLGDASRFYGNVPLTGIDGLDNVEIFLEQTRLTRESLNELLFQNLDRHEINARLSRLFFINSADDGLEPLTLSQDESCGYEKLLNLSPDKLDRIYRFLKLSHKLGWSFTDLDWALRSLYKPYAPEKVLKFDGIKDYIACHNYITCHNAELDLLKLGQFTLEGWVCPNSSRKNVVIDLFADRSPLKDHILLEVNSSNKLFFYIERQDKSESKFVELFKLESNSSLPLGTFSHIALVVGNDEAGIYIDGVLDAKTTLKTPFSDVRSGRYIDFNIGRDLFDEYFDGCIKDIRVWKIARDAAAIKEYRFRRFTDEEIDLIGYWPLVCHNTELDLFKLDQFTIEAWVCPDSSGRNVIMAILADRSPLKDRILLEVNSSNKLFFYIEHQDKSESSEPKFVESNSSLPLGSFTHIALVVENDEASIYIDGVLDAKTALETPFSDVRSGRYIDFNIGRDLFDEYFDGCIKDVRIWKIARDAAAIMEDRYKRFTGNELDLIGYWPLTEGGDNAIVQPKWVYRNLILDPLPIWEEDSHLKFNGVDQYLEARGVDIAEMREFSIEAWIRIDELKESCVICLSDDSENPKAALKILNGSNNQGLLSLQMNFPSLPINWQSLPHDIDRFSIPQRKLTHLCVVLKHEPNKPSKLEMYINGTLNGEYSLPSQVSMEIKNGEINVGRDLFGHYFHGGIKEIRVWNLARSRDEIALNMYRPVPSGDPGLIGYWRLNEVDDGVARDLSYHRNDLCLGGIQADYMPVPATTDVLPRTFPAPAKETILKFDGDNDVIAIKNSNNWGLGRYERMTLGLWFKPENPVNSDRKQIIFTQGDKEAGLNIYLHKGCVYVLEWNSSFNEKSPAQSVLKSQIIGNDWHYVVLTHKEFPQEIRESDNIQFEEDMRLLFKEPELRGYLDGKPMISADDNSGNFVCKGYRLSSVGIAYLGGLGQKSVTRFEDGYSEDRKEHQYFFAGNIADLRIWNSVKPADQIIRDHQIARDCYLAPQITDDLVTYMPMVKGEDWIENDKEWIAFGWPKESQRNPHSGTLQRREMALVTDSADPQLTNIYSHYSNAAALEWNDYVYSGRMRITEKNAAVGVTFFSRHTEGIDQCYLLGYIPGPDNKFRLFAHPFDYTSDIKTLQPNTGSDTIESTIIPDINVWYCFEITVKDAGSSTEIMAEIWPEDSPNLKESLNAIDKSDIRIRKGTVGLWSSGSSKGKRQFDDLLVKSPNSNVILLDKNFEDQSEESHPANWWDVEDRIKPVPREGLFKSISVDGGETVFGTDSTDSNIHSYYIDKDKGALSWSNYLYQGRMRISDANGSIGVTFLSRQPKEADQYYALCRVGEQGTFKLFAHPKGVQSIKSREPGKDMTDSGIDPLPNIWYRFLIKVQDDGSKTMIQAKIWPETSVMPEAFQIDAYDDSSIRIRSGTAGVWASGSGSKYFNDLKVFSKFSISESFERYSAGQEDPLNWRDTKANYSNEEDSSLFKIFDVGCRKVLGTKSHETRIHSHYIGSDASAWSNYVYTGKMRIGDTGKQNLSGIGVTGGIGVTFLSNYFPDQTKQITYYRLLYDAGDIEKRGFHIAFPQSDKSLKGIVDSKFSPNPNTWYRFKIEVEDTKDKTIIKAKVWPESEAEPLGYQIDAYDDNPNRLKSGTVGVVTLGVGSKYFDDLEVTGGTLLSSSYALEEWVDVGSRIYQKNDALFSIADLSNNALRWQVDSNYPVLLHPLSKKALEFDGERQYLAAPKANPDLSQFTPESLSQFTLESWISLSETKEGEIEEGPIISLSNNLECEPKATLKEIGDGIIFCTDSSGCIELWLKSGDQLAQFKGDSNPLPKGQFIHVAASVKASDATGDRVTFFVNGEGVKAKASDPSMKVPDFSRLKILRGDIGRDGIGRHFYGKIKEVRIWSKALDENEIKFGLYQRPTVSPALLRYWSLGEDDKDIVEDLSSGKNPLWIGTMRLGGMEEDRRPKLQPSKCKPTVLPKIPLDEAALEGIATIKRLKEAYNQPIDRLIALWHSINHVGKDGQTPLFDRIFNPKGSIIEHWNYFMDEPISWDKTGKKDRRRDGQIRSRLMGALRVSNDDLNAIVERISGSNEIIDIDGAYLWRMYQIAGLAGLLRLGVTDLLQLLSIIKKDFIGSLHDVSEICDLAEWANDAGLSVADLAYLTHDPMDLGAVPATLFTEANLKSMAVNLAGQSHTTLINSESFVSDQISQAQSSDIFSLLYQPLGLITDIGAVTAKYTENYDLIDLLGIFASPDKENWILEFNPLKAELEQAKTGLGDEIIQRLISHGFINENGVVLDKPAVVDDKPQYGKENLMVIFDDNSPDEITINELSSVTEILERRKALQAEYDPILKAVHTALKKSRDDLYNAVQSELADVFNTQVGIMSVIFDYLDTNGEHDVPLFIEKMIELSNSDSTLPATLKNYFSRMSKLVYMAGAFDMTDAEMKTLLSDPVRFSISNLLQPTFRDLDNLHLFKRLQLDFGDTEGKLMGLLALKDTTEIKNALDDLAGWDPRQVKSLAEHFGVSKYNTLQGLRHLKACFDLAGSMQVGVDYLLQFADTSMLGKADEHAFYSKQSSGLLEILRAGYTDEEWPEVYGPIYGELAEKRRDALLDLALHRLPATWNEYLFSPDKIPGSDEEGLRIFLGRKLKLNWADGAFISRQDGTVFVSTIGKNWAKIALGEDKAILTTDGGLTIDLIYDLEYLFCWDNIPGSGIRELKDFLENRIGLVWVENASINKSADVITIEGDSLEKKVTLTLTTTPGSNDGTVTLVTLDHVDSLKVRRKNDKWNVYRIDKKKIYRQNRFKKGADAFQEYFLMDMRVGKEVLTSRIVQGTAALQYYIQRCLMNLEPGVDPSTIPMKEWEWVKNYRVWEANRKVFLYPENYIEPELRDTKTPLFEELEQELLQSDITQESAEAAFTHYLEKFAEVADLKIVGSYLHTDVTDKRSASPADRDEVLYLIGRTNTNPRIYYLREHVKDEFGERWLPWKKIDLVINSDFATLVYAFGKLFLFWTEFTKLTKSVDRRLSDQILDTHGVPKLLSMLYIIGNGFRIINSINNKIYTINTFKSSAFTDDVCYDLARLIDEINGLLLLHLKVIYPSYHEIQNDILGFILNIFNAYAIISLYKKVYLDLLAELGDRDIRNLEDGKWVIDGDGYLFNTETDQRVQETVDFYNSTVKYSYLNFNKGWIQPQTYVELNNELTETIYREPRWQRVYAQQVLELGPKKTDQLKPKEETDVKVLQIDERTQLNKRIPEFDMSRITWEFWTKFINTNTDFPGWPDSIKEEDMKKSIRLVDYDNGNFNITATNKIVVSQAYEAAKETADLVKEAQNYVNDKRYQEAAEKAKQAKNKASNASFVDSTNVAGAANDARKAAENTMEKISEASAARAAATEARERANEKGLDQEEKVRRELEATRLEDKAIKLKDETASFEKIALDEVTEACYAAKKALKNTPKWESKAVTLKVQLWENELPAEMDYDIWQHIAIIFDEKNGSCTVTLYKHKDGVETFLGSLTGKCLPSQKSLVIGDQKADVWGAFIAQISEFRLWNHVRDIKTIKDEMNYRKTGKEKGLFYLPLNFEEPGSNMTLVKSEGLNFTKPILNGGLLNRIAERERIILFYGDHIASLRNNLKDKSFNLKLAPKEQMIYDLSLSYLQADQDTLPKAMLHLTETIGLSINDFATGEDGTILARPAKLPTTDVDPQKWLLKNLEGAESSFADVNNQPGWYIVDVGDEQFLIKAEFSNSDGNSPSMPTMTEISKVNYDDASNKEGSPVALSVSYELEDGNALVVSESTTKTFKFERLNTFAVYELSENLFTGGIDKLLSLESQHAKELHFWEEYETNKELVPPDINRIPNEIDFQGAYRLYFEEIFFQIPFLIANKLNSNQKFEDAQKWYHYIFNPTASEEVGAQGRDKDRYWRYLPFRDDSFQSLRTLLTDEHALAAYRKDPFDPHAIAALRMTAYKKAVVMKYIDNLLDWGDSLFMQDIRESVNEALGLYIMAYDLLGPRPKVKTIKRFQEIGTYEDFACDYRKDSEFLTAVENLVPCNCNATTLNPHSNIITDFCVPENEKFIGYWDRVEDRLFKLRHSLNFEGISRQLALFAPPIDPMELVRAVAGGASISGALSALSVAVPHYRYSFMLERAKDMTSNVMELGSALLGAIESRDAEQLAILQNTHERAILDLTTSIKEKEIELAEEAIAALEISEKSPEYKIEWYQQRIDEYMNGEEIAELVLIGSGQVAKSAGAVLKAISAATAGMPHLHSGGAGLASPVFITTYGGSNISEPCKYAAEICDISADIINTAANMTAKMGVYKRRKGGWEFEKSLAEKELEEIEKQIAIAKIQLALANQELAIHSKTVQQNQEIERFYRSKFSNETLYSWMIGRLSGLYFQAYKLAYDMAKSAEKALQYELPTTETYITPGHWDSLKKGLLAGESLMLELNRMEKSHLDQDSRFQEIEKTISMNRTFPGSLLLLAASGACEFRLSEELFDRDYPGHYFRVIKSIEIDIKTSKRLEPYESVNATLIQLGNKTLIDPDIGAVGYLMGSGSEQPNSNTLRVNWRANQQIAISKVNEKDDGMFVLNFFWDDRYFPFEGTGAVSSWRLEIPHSSNPDLMTKSGNVSVLDIEDVLIHIRYTAKSERGSFKKEVEKLLGIK